MSYAEEIERAADECRRRSAQLLDELEQINRATAATSRELAETSAAGMREFHAAHADELAKARAELAERERLETQAREQREAIARSIAARKANREVLPVDQEDEEAAFYQRESWLI
ncbi:hypothetical protein DFR70_103264 [Nocardia tenerifensis]|uniref:Uncharacterized protein n=1 Tax=Nocardia tenerifensis TaxID=228006 RepID=A0A318K9Q0_9NOCA|nr:hypothetical protein [Nocardia tenerifensis]PXX66515.1 hypothetical protein DFR70_103264 [Nocardia tenerifensis]